MSCPPLQKDAFLASEGDAWFLRNGSARADLETAAAHDPLLGALRDFDLPADTVLEVGASDGWRLEALRRERPDTRCWGIEPSAAAVTSGRERFPELRLEVGTADDLPFESNSVDLMLFGFCLYLCDRADLFRIAAEADRVLTANGAIVIYDFHTEAPYANPYAHLEGLASYKMDHASLFTWNPAYRVQLQDVFPHPGPDGRIPPVGSPDDQVAVTILRRDLDQGWPTGRPDHAHQTEARFLAEPL